MRSFERAVRLHGPKKARDELRGYGLVGAFALVCLWRERDAVSEMARFLGETVRGVRRIARQRMESV